MYLNIPFLESYVTKYIKTCNYVPNPCCLHRNSVFIPNPAPPEINIMNTLV